MTTSSNANGAAMIVFLVFVALHAAKVSSISIFLHVRLLFYLHIHHVARHVFGGQIHQRCIKLSQHQRRFLNRKAACLDEQDRRAGCLGWPYESAPCGRRQIMYTESPSDKMLLGGLDHHRIRAAYLEKYLYCSTFAYPNPFFFEKGGALCQQCNGMQTGPSLAPLSYCQRT